MSDVTVTEGVGKTVRSIDNGDGKQRQVIAIDLGSQDGSGAEKIVNAGQATMANSLPVVVASNQSAVPVSGSVTANAGTNLNTSALAVESGGNLAAVKADLDEIATDTDNLAGIKTDTDRLDIALSALRDAITKTGATAKTLADIVAALGFSQGAGVTDATTLRVITASDGPLNSVLGTKTDAKDAHTDGTSISQMQVFKEISYLLQNALSVSGSVTADTELPAAAALADGASNPTAPMVGSDAMGFNGATWDRVRIPSLTYDMSTVTITSIATVATPTSGKKFRILGGSFSVSAACSVLFEDNSAGNGTIFRTPKLLADTPYSFDIGNGYLSKAANNVVKATASAAATIIGTLYAVEE